MINPKLRNQIILNQDCLSNYIPFRSDDVIRSKSGLKSNFLIFIVQYEDTYLSAWHGLDSNLQHKHKHGMLNKDKQKKKKKKKRNKNNPFAELFLSVNTRRFFRSNTANILDPMGNKEVMNSRI